MRPKPASQTSSNAEGERRLNEICPGELNALIAGFLDNVTGAFIVLDEHWCLAYLNRDAREFFASKDEPLIGRPFEDVYPKQYGYLLAPESIRELLEGRENTIIRYVNKLNKWYKIYADASDRGVFIRLEDVTRDMDSNRLMRLNKFSVENAADMVFWFKPGGQIIYANSASCRSLGFEKRELTGMMVADIDPSFPDNKWAVFVEDLRTKGSMVYESRFLTHDHSIIPTEVTCSYLVYRGEEYLIASARDITERKRAEEALWESETHRKVVEAVESERLRLFEVLETLPMMICLLTPDYHVAFANRSFREMFGESHGRHCYDYCFGFTGPCEFCEAYKVLETGRPHHWEVARPDGCIIDVYDTPFTDVDGSPMILEMDVDITERKLTEETLRESEEKFRQVAETSPAVIIIYRGENNIYMNPAGELITGYTLDEFLKLRSWEIVHPDYRKFIQEKTSMRMQGVPLSERYDVKIVTKDGRERWMSNSTAPIIYMNQPAGLVIAIDITERKLAEEALRDSQAHLNSIFRAAPTGIGVAIERVITEVNDRLCEMTGYTREELVGKNARILYASDEEYETVGEEKYAQIERWGTGNVETRWRRKDDSMIDILLSSTPLEPGDLQMGVTFTALDITKRKRAEEELKAAKAQAELYVDLMGHDINNIHQAALGYLELARDIPGNTRDEYLDKATEALKRSTQLISNVRKLQKFHDDRMRIYDVDVCDMLTGVYKEYVAAPGKTITLNLNGHQYCYVRADDLLHDVFSNLVSNAVKHTGDQAHVSINLDIVRDDGAKYCRVLVEDDGPGIPDESKKTLFNRSLKGTPRAKGMGFGLYIVKTLVENYGGRSWAEDRIEGDHTKGARFVVILPAVEG